MPFVEPNRIRFRYVVTSVAAQSGNSSALSLDLGEFSTSLERFMFSSKTKSKRERERDLGQRSRADIASSGLCRV